MVAAGCARIAREPERSRDNISTMSHDIEFKIRDVREQLTSVSPQFKSKTVFKVMQRGSNALNWVKVVTN